MKEQEKTQEQGSLFASLITVVLVVIESFFSLVLRFDDELRKAAYPLASKDCLLVVRSYLPHEELYVTFSYKGLLIDTEMPSHKEHADIIINAHSFEIVDAIVSDKQKAIDKLQYRGSEEDIELVKNFLFTLSFNSIVEKLLKRFNKKQNAQLDAKKPERKKSDPKQKIAKLKTELDTVKINNTKLSTQVAEYKSKEKSKFPVAVIALVVGIGIGRFFL